MSNENDAIANIQLLVDDIKEKITTQEYNQLSMALLKLYKLNFSDKKCRIILTFPMRNPDYEDEEDCTLTVFEFKYVGCWTHVDNVTDGLELGKNIKIPTGNLAEVFGIDICNTIQSLIINTDCEILACVEFI